VIVTKCAVGWDEDARALVVHAVSEADTAVAFIVLGQGLSKAGAFKGRADELWEQLRKELVDTTMPPTVLVNPGSEKAKA
jgi:hypothetical protein